MDLTRRHLLAGLTAVVSGLSGPGPGRARAAAGSRQPLGLVIDSLTIRRAASRARPATERLDDASVFLEHGHALGARGIQVGLGVRSEAQATRLRERAEALDMYVEGSVRLPRDPTDVDRFAAEVQTARHAGVPLLRTVMLSGRRYEVFDTAESFRRFADEAFRSLTLAEPVVARHGVRLAVENHKDWLASQLVEILQRIGSESVGACLDTGNNVALLEDPMEVVATLAPWALTTHIKDMGVREYEQGFLLSEVPLGEGFLDLPRAVRLVRAVRPGIRLNLEMITRDPLKIPCLTPKYWATFENRPARDLARMLTLVRERAAKGPLPEVSGLSAAARLKAEDENLLRSFAYALDHLAS